MRGGASRVFRWLPGRCLDQSPTTSPTMEPTAPWVSGILYCLVDVWTSLLPPAQPWTTLLPWYCTVCGHIVLHNNYLEFEQSFTTESTTM